MSISKGSLTDITFLLCVEKECKVFWVSRFTWIVGVVFAQTFRACS